MKTISLQFHYKEFYFLPLYSLCSVIFSYSFFSKDSKSEISKGLCGSSPSALCHELGYPHNATGNRQLELQTIDHGFEVKRYLEFDTLTLKKVSHPNKKIFSTMFCLRITRLLERLQNLFKSSIQTKVQAVLLVLRQRGQLRQC